MKTLELKQMSLANIEGTLTVSEMEEIMGGNWRCIVGIGAGAVAGFSGSTGNGVAFLLGPIAITWGAVGAVAGAVLGAATAC